MNKYLAILLGLISYLIICFISPEGPYQQYLNPRSFMFFFVAPLCCGFITGMLGGEKGWKLALSMQITFNVLFYIYSIIDMSLGGVVQFSFLVFFNFAHVAAFSIPSIPLAALGGFLSTKIKLKFK